MLFTLNPGGKQKIGCWLEIHINETEQLAKYTFQPSQPVSPNHQKCLLSAGSHQEQSASDPVLVWTGSLLENPLNICYLKQPHWPPLAWLATWTRDGKTIEVLHGNRVESEADWFGEIVWDGKYEQRCFDETDIVIGSGARLIDDGIIFVSASNTLDRLVSASFGERHFVSNSIVCISAHTQTEFDPWYASYPSDFKSIIRGPDQYVRDFESSRGKIRLTYFKNLKFDGTRFVEIPKPQFVRQRDSFAAYRDFLHSALERCCDNLRDPNRKHSWDLMGTLSTGFDSTTVAALATQHGLKEAITITSSRGGGSDCGTPIGESLGLQVHEVARDAWKSCPNDETLFLSADAKGEDVYFRGAGDLLQNRVLLTGYCGSIWGGRSENYLRWKRTDQSGLSLTEYRLHVGMLNFPVASIGVYGAKDLLELMGSAEVEQWASGNSYDKPFCRMVLTEAGVPDELYGNQKKAASVLMEDRSSFLSDDSRSDFEAWLGRLFAASPGKSGRYRAARIGESLSRKMIGAGVSISSAAGSLTGSKFLNRIGSSVKLSEYAAGEPNYRFLFPWAMEHAKKRYRSS